jgi:hypothetical protein
MNGIKQMILAPWDFMRWLRLALGLFFVYQASIQHDMLAGFMGSFFLFQAITNTGFCGTACSIPTSSREENTSNEVTFEEIKKKE